MTTMYTRQRHTHGQTNKNIHASKHVLREERLQHFFPQQGAARVLQLRLERQRKTFKQRSPGGEPLLSYQGTGGG